MITKPKDGGQAFPLSPTSYAPHGVLYGGDPGMSLRDWLIGMALQGILSNEKLTDDWDSFISHQEIKNKVNVAFLIADTVLAEGSKNEQAD